MSEEKIILAIAETCRDNSLYFQIIIQAQTLHIYVNRQTDSLDYQKLTSNVHLAVTSLSWLEVSEIWLYSRILGEVEPDWQTYVEIEDPKQSLWEKIEFLAEEIEAEVETTGNLVENLSAQSKLPDSQVSLVREIEQELESTGFLVAKLKKELDADL